MSAPQPTPQRRRTGSPTLVGWLAALFALLLVALPARAAPQEPGSASAMAAASAAMAAASAAGTEVAEREATLTIFNRRVVRFRAALPGLQPPERARRARDEILKALQAGGPGEVGATTTPQGTMILVDGVGVFPLLEGDLDGGQEADGVVAALSQAMNESLQARTFGYMLRASGWALAGTLVFALVWWTLRWLRNWFGRVLVSLGQRHGRRLSVGGTALISSERIFGLVRGATSLVYYLLLLVAAVEWLGFVLRRFPYTRRWGEELNESSVRLAIQIAGAVADSLPGLAVAVVIFMIARGVLGLIQPFFAQVERGELSLAWIDRYTVRATRGLVQISVWLFALAMAYPYLPGSETEAFKGLTVLLGLMLSLGSSNLVGQAVSGLILTYSRTLHVGEYVRVAEVEGTVIGMDTFATRIHTGLGEELTLPNSLIVGSVTKNYSRTVKGSGYIVDTVLTIGYDTPWRQVHAMMIEGAQRTEGILATPAPHVFQTALSDFYVEYRLVAQAVASAPRPRAQVLADLHAHLQDVFNENGVQIMSPHYLGDPGQAKIVLPEHWNPPLAGKR